MAMRRAPRIWEQKLEKMIRSAGVAGLGAASSAVVTPGPTPGPDAGGSEPAPPPIVDVGPEIPRTPPPPSVFPAIGGFSILWTGLDSNGVPYPTGTRVQVHVSTTNGFTPSDATQRGLLAAGERVVLTDLISGTTYYIRFVLVAPDGQVGEVGAQVSAVAGFVLQSNIGTGTITAGMVSFDATAIGGIQQFVGTSAPPVTNVGTANQLPKNGSTWINTSNGSYNVLESGSWVTRPWGASGIAANAITETKIANDAITTPKIAANAITADEIAANAITSTKVAAGAISTLQLAAGAITAESAIIANGAIQTAMIGDAQITNAKVQSLEATKLTAGTIDASQITIRTAESGPRVQFDVNGIKGYNTFGQETFSLSSFNGDALVTGNFRTGDSGARIEMGTAYGVLSGINFFSSTGQSGSVGTGLDGGLLLSATSTRQVTIFGDTVSVQGDCNFDDPARFYSSVDVDGQFTAGLSGGNAAFRVQNDDVYSYGIDDNTTAFDANVRVGANAQLFRSTSTVRLKDELVPLVDDLTGVPADKIADFPASVDPYDVLSLTPTEFRSLSTADDQARMLGFIAEDVAEKLPWAANWDKEGLPCAVDDRPILAALLYVVREQQSVIEDLRARVEVLES